MIAVAPAQLSIHEAKTQLSRIVSRVEAGIKAGTTPLLSAGHEGEDRVDRGFERAAVPFCLSE